MALLIGSAQAAVVLKKNMVITCPSNHEPVYKLAKSFKDTDSGLTANHLYFYGTKKHPKQGDGFLCDAAVSSWRGVCIHTNKGWVPEACQKGLRVKLEFEPFLE